MSQTSQHIRLTQDYKRDGLLVEIEIGVHGLPADSKHQLPLADAAQYALKIIEQTNAAITAMPRRADRTSGGGLRP